MSPAVFFNDTATTEIYTLSLHDALPICRLSTIAESGSSLSSSSRTSLSTCPNTGHANNINNKVKRYFLVSPIKLYIFIIIFSHPFHQLSAEPILVLRLHGHHAVGPIHDHHKAAQPSQEIGRASCRERV